MSLTCGTCRFGVKEPTYPAHARRCIGAPPTAYKVQRLKQQAAGSDTEAMPEIEVIIEAIDPPVQVTRPACALYKGRGR